MLITPHVHIRSGHSDANVGVRLDKIVVTQGPEGLTSIFDIRNGLHGAYGTAWQWFDVTLWRWSLSH